MDFLNPKKQRAQIIRLIIGYVLVGIAIILATIVLVYLAYGFALDKGKIIQNGLVFVSSHPGGSNIRVSDKIVGQTSTRMSLPAGSYDMRIERNGYSDWQRTITVDGNSVERYDYPFLFPKQLETKTTTSFSVVPPDASQSPSRRWILVETSVSGNFTLVDVNNPKKAVTSTVNLPASVLTKPTTLAPETLKTVEWSHDNRHVLLQHAFDKTYEYIMFDTQDPSKSVNLSKTLNIPPPVEVSLQNKLYDHYFIFNPDNKTLKTENLATETPTDMLQNVLYFKSYGNNIILYATDQDSPEGQSAIMLYQNQKSYFLRNVAKSDMYLLDLTQYSGSWYIVAGSSADSRVYVYKNPVDALSAPTDNLLVPVTVLKVDHPDWVSFSDSAQFIVAENATSFAVYDVQYDNNYVYKLNSALDKPQLHAQWMDGDRLDYISGGKLVVFDYDGINYQPLMAADPNYTAFFDSGYSKVYSITTTPKTATASAISQLTNTYLLTPADQ